MTASDDRKRKDDLRRKLMRGFDEGALKGTADQQKREAERRERRREEDVSFAKRGEQGLKEDAEREKRRKLDEARWRRDEAERKRELERFKQRKREEEKYLKDRKEKERKFEEKKRKYFESLHEAAAVKALAERAEFEANQELDKDLDALEHEAREAKAKAERDCVRAKEQIERDRLSERDRLDHLHQDDLIRLHGEELRRREAIDTEHHSALATAGNLPEPQRSSRRAEAEAQYRAKSSALGKDLDKKRQDLEIRFSSLREAANREALTLRSRAESALHAALQEIESQKQLERSRLIGERERTRKRL